MKHDETARTFYAVTIPFARRFLDGHDAQPLGFGVKLLGYVMGRFSARGVARVVKQSAVNGSVFLTSRAFSGMLNCVVMADWELVNDRDKGCRRGTALKAARRNGYSTVVTSPTPDSESMYERIGFTLFASVLNAYHRWPADL